MRSALLVGDGWEGRNVLAAAWGLSAGGWRVGVASPMPGLAAASRFTRWHRVCSPTEDLGAFEQDLQEVVRQGSYDVLLAGGDAEVLALAALAERLPAAVPYPPLPATVQAFDKWTLTRAAEAVGLAVPATIRASDRWAAAVEFPTIVKSRLHWKPGHRAARARLEAVEVEDDAELDAAVGAIESAGGDAIVQERVAGSMTAYVALMDRDGDVVVEWQQDGHGTWPVAAGVWTRAVTVPLNPELAETARVLLRRLGWLGLAQLQFLVGSDGQPKLIDFNGRFYASGALPLAAGINVADMWARLAIGLPVAPIAPPPPGLRYQWLVGDVLRALEERRGGLGRDLRDCVRYRLRSVHSTWRRDDPMPAVRFAASRLSRSSARGLAGHFSRNPRRMEVPRSG
jgi:predicted ATP-grasp superfamily ATP-dependent carboligase